MLVGKNDFGEMFFTTMIKGKFLILNQYKMCKDLGLNAKILGLAKIDAFSEFTKFSQMNFKKFLKFLCESSVPKAFYSSPRDLSLKFFNPKSQFLVKIIRANVLPQLESDKLFDYNNIQLMYFISTCYVPFNLPYFLISSMINCAYGGLMAYGLLLTKIFKANYIELSEEIAIVVDKHLKGTLSLPVSFL